MNENMRVEEEQLSEQIGADQDQETWSAGNPSLQEKIPDQNTGGNEHLPWFNRDEIESLRSRWSSIQAQFVDEPRRTVEQGDALVSETLERLTQMLSDQHANLNQRWSKNYDLSTEDLRKTLQSYRSLFNRLLGL